jgi:hypothetical protein
MHLPLGIHAGLVALSCAGCAGGPPRVSSDRGAVTTDPDSLRISLDLPREVRSGQPVPIVIRLENTGTKPLDLYLRGRTIAFDVFVADSNGDVVWQRLKDQVIPAIIQLKVLQPGGVLELEEEWLQRGNGGEPLGPGSYLVRGSVLTDGPALETAPASLRIVPS